ncbi:acyl carrier protein [uncultured Ruminococcus sp.]|jgi:acyl carrier protein|uniref:acyl carrier protein n=1 Tax=uncultured Ruminococcus sp. TaxID=165186 RepID=UPI00262179D0|nr:acyl carrier protein [uncultured Ruminococcus sp.]
MFEIMKKVLEEEYGITDIAPDMNIRRDLGLSSFDLMNLICIVEERFGIELDEEQYRHLTTVGEMCDMVGALAEKQGI